MLKIKSGFSLLESLIALFVLSMVTLVYVSSSSIFFNAQTSLIKSDRKDQLADLILQDIMEYVSQKNSELGTITVRTNQNFSGATSSIQLTGFTKTPSMGDIFLVDGVRGRYVVDSVTGTGSDRTVIASSNFPTINISAGTSVSFIAFKKQELNCFDGLDLTSVAPASIGTCTSLPTEVVNLHNHWKTQIDNELGSEITIRNIEVTDGNLVKVTLGNGTNNTVLAKKINVCIFDDTPNTVAFNFPGLDDPITTGIMEHNENPTEHYFASGSAKKFNSLTADTPTGGRDEDTITCLSTWASTCRQTYAWSNTITVFLYRYTGADVRVRPSGCDDSADAPWTGQCNGVRVNQNDLSLWFIFDEYNHKNGTSDTSQIGFSKPGWNEQGYLLYDVRNLPTNARILVFDDAKESCIGAITAGTCTGRYKWSQAHDGLVIHLGTSNLATLDDIELEITGVPYGVNKWRILRSDVANCLLASGRTNSAHGEARNQEDENECWNYVEAYHTTTTSAITSSSNSVTLADSSYFPSSGSVQIGSEYVNYSSNNTATNTLSGLSRGRRNVGTLPSSINASDSIPGSSYTFKKTLNNQNTQIGFWGGYVKINNEVFKVDYCSTRFLNPNECANIGFDDFDANKIRFLARAQKGTTAQTHNAGAGVRNYDMRPRSWPAGTRVWEGPTHSIPVVQAENSSGVFERVRLKRRVTLNLSATAVCS